MGIFLLVFSLTSFGCADISKRTDFNPIEANGWQPLYNSKTGQSRLYYNCGSFQVEAHYIPIVNVTYAIGPILPVIPIYDKGTDKSQESLGIELILDGSLSNITLSEKSIALTLDKGSTGIKPKSFTVSYGKPQTREYYHFVFDISQEAVRGFTVVFPETVNGCPVPPLKYEYKDLGLVYDVLAN